MTPKQTRFVAEYLANGLNATKAAESSGYSKKTAYSQGQRLLKDVEVQAAIAKKTQKHMDRTDFSIDRTLEFVSRMAFFDPKDLFEDDGSLKQIKDIPEHARTVLGGLEVVELFEGTGDEKHAYGLLKKVKLADRGAALDKLMRYHSLYKDKVEVTGLESLADAISRARKRQS